MDSLFTTPRALKVIDTVVGSEERRRSVLRTALESSGHLAIPESLEELMVFVRAHLLPALSEQIGPRLATVVLADIDFAIQKEFRERLREASSEPTHSEPPASKRATIRRRALELTKTSRNGIGAWNRKQSCAVLVVDRDRLGASMLARGVIHSGCEVAVAEPDTVDTALVGSFEPDVLVLGERDVLDMPSALRTLLMSRPHIAIVVRVGDHRLVAESMLKDMGSHKCATISLTAPTLEVVGLARQLYAEMWAAAFAS